MGKSPSRGGRRAPARRSTGKRWPYIVAAIVFVFLATVGRGFVTQFLVRTHVAELRRIESTVHLRGHLLWQEEVLTAPLTGRLALHTACGEQVRAGCVLAEIYNPQTEAAIQQQIEDAKAELTRFQALASVEEPSLQAELNETTAILVEAINGFRQAPANRLATYQERLVATLDSHSQKVSELAQLAAQEGELLAELERVRSQRADFQQIISATIPGKVVHTLDGLEDTLSWERADRLTPRTLFTLDGAVVQSLDGQRIKAGDPVVKLIDTREALWAVATEEGRVNDLILGMRVILRTEEGVQVPGQVADLRYGSPPGYAVVIISINEGVEQLGQERILEATLVKTSSEGIQIPHSALWEQEGRMGVYVVYKTMVRFQPVDILVAREGWALVLGLASGDEVITTPRWVTDGQRIR